MFALQKVGRSQNKRSRQLFRLSRMCVVCRLDPGRGARRMFARQKVGPSQSRPLRAPFRRSHRLADTFVGN